MNYRQLLEVMIAYILQYRLSEEQADRAWDILVSVNERSS